MWRPLSRAFGIAISALLLTGGASLVTPLVAQDVLAQLGLSEAQARTLLFDELKSPSGGLRRKNIAVIGHRAF